MLVLGRASVLVLGRVLPASVFIVLGRENRDICNVKVVLSTNIVECYTTLKKNISLHCLETNAVKIILKLRLSFCILILKPRWDRIIKQK